MSIEVHKTSSGYNKKKVLHEIDLKIAKGSFTVLLGPNGCGKSTLLKTMARVIEPFSGIVSVEGQDVLKTPTKTMAQVLSFLPQNPIVPSGITVDQLVGYGRAPYQSLLGMRSEKDRQVIEDSMVKTGVDDLKDRLVSELSGGQRQRVFIAMNLAQDTEYMMLDEPTTFLDIKYQYETLDLLARFNQEGRTIVVVLHDLAQAARYASDLVVMSEGSVYAQGSPQDIVTSEMVKDVFGLDCQVFSDPVTGTPMLSPVSR